MRGIGFWTVFDASESVCDRMVEALLLGLFDAFSLKCGQLKQAVAGGHDGLVRLLDQELEPIIADILAYRAKTCEEAHMQLQFLNGLIREEAEDRSSVIRRSTAMSMLIDRYFQAANEAGDTLRPPSRKPENGLPFGVSDQPLFNQAVLDTLPDRVGVITRDYRYLYANQANAAFLGRTQLSMVGCHVSDFIGEESFTMQAKPAFDRCFGGEVVDYVHHGRRDGENFTTRCRMKPLRAVSNDIIGAVITLQSAGEMVAIETW